MQDKYIDYMQLVEKRKKYAFHEGLLNPSRIENGKYDSGMHIGSWSKWQGNLDAKILVVGQDWGDLNYFIKSKGCDSDENPTSKNLVELFKTLDIDIGLPNNPNKNAPVFFTNAILGIKDGGMSSDVKSKWIKEGANEFLKPLIDIVSPAIIITLGKKPYDAIAEIYKLKKNDRLNTLIDNVPIELQDKILLFPMFHCGGLGLRNRSLTVQKKDWEKIENYI